MSPASQTITFGALADKALGALPFTVSATASSGLPVSFAIVSGPATMLAQHGDDHRPRPGEGAGLAGGSSDYAAAIPVERSFTVAVVTSTVTVRSNNSPSLSGVPITLTATVSPTAATGAVSFKDGATAIVCASGSVLSAPLATCNTSALAIGTHAITAVYAGNSSLAGSTSASFSQVITPSAKLNVKFNVYALQDNTSKPKVTVFPAKNALVKVFSTANSCVGNIFSALNPKKWGTIFDGADGVGGADGCSPVSLGAIRRRERPT